MRHEQWPETPIARRQQQLSNARTEIVAWSLFTLLFAGLACLSVLGWWWPWTLGTLALASGILFIRAIRLHRRRRASS